MHNGKTGRRQRDRRNIWSNKGWEFSNIYDRHQTTAPGSSEDIKHDKLKKKSTSKHIMFKLKKNQRQRKHGRAGVEEITYRGIRLRMTSDLSSEIMKARRE